MKDLDWLREEVIKISENWTENIRGDFAKGLDRAVGHTVKLIDQLDKMVSMDELNKLKEKNHHLKEQLNEQETLSPEWIDGNKTTYIRIKDDAYYVPVYKLQNLLVPKQELPVIPKFVADWVESRDYYNVYKVLQDLSAPGSPHASKDVRNWIFRNQENVEKFVRAWLDGYTVEEEQKYYVLNTEGETMIRKSDSRIRTSSGFKMRNGFKNENYKFTEKEIKYYEQRDWPFAVKVEELEE